MRSEQEHPFEIRLAPNGKGLGVFATKAHKPGDLIFELPAVFVVLNEPNYDEIGRRWAVYHKENPDDYREDMTHVATAMKSLQMWSADAAQTSGRRQSFVHEYQHFEISEDLLSKSIRFNSSAQLPELDMEEADRDSVQEFLAGCNHCYDFGRVPVLAFSRPCSYLNHACSPNTLLSNARHKRPDISRPWFLGPLQLRAILPIASGDELTIAYALQPIACSETHRYWLEANHGFRCACDGCLHETQQTYDLSEQVYKSWKYLDVTADKSGSSIYKAGYDWIQALKALRIEGGSMHRVFMILYEEAVRFGDAIRAEYFAIRTIHLSTIYYGKQHFTVGLWLEDLATLRAQKTVPSRVTSSTESVIREVRRKVDESDLQRLIFMLDHDNDHYYNLQVLNGGLVEESMAQSLNRTTGAEKRSDRRQRGEDLFACTNSTIESIPGLFQSAEADAAFADICREIEQSQDQKEGRSPKSAKKKKKKAQQRVKNSALTIASPEMDKVTSETSCVSKMDESCSQATHVPYPSHQVENSQYVADEWTVVNRHKLAVPTKGHDISKTQVKIARARLQTGSPGESSCCERGSRKDSINSKNKSSSSNLNIGQHEIPSTFPKFDVGASTTAALHTTAEVLRDEISTGQHTNRDCNDIDCAQSLVFLAHSASLQTNSSSQQREVSTERREIASAGLEVNASATVPTVQTSVDTMVQSTIITKHYPKTVPRFVGFSRRMALVMRPAHDMDAMAKCLGTCGKRVIFKAVVAKQWPSIDYHQPELNLRKNHLKALRLFRAHRYSDNTDYST